MKRKPLDQHIRELEAFMLRSESRMRKARQQGCAPVLNYILRIQERARHRLARLKLRVASN